MAMRIVSPTPVQQASVVYRDARCSVSGSASTTATTSTAKSAKVSEAGPTRAIASEPYKQYAVMASGSRSSVSVPPPGPRQCGLQRFLTQGPMSPAKPATSRDLVSASPVLAAASAKTTVPAKTTSTTTAASCFSPKKETRSAKSASIPPAPSDPSMTLPSIWNGTFELDKNEPVLGGGAFAKILRVAESASGTEYAIKVMNRPNFTIRGIEAQLDAEIEAMKRCAKSRQCRHVVRLYETAEESQHVYLRLELCKYDLLRYSNNQPHMRLVEHDTQDFTRQLLVGLRDLHGLGILHRDIKPENLLLTWDGILKIADFGWCAELSEGPSTLAGTFQYMAPEILGSMGVQTEAVDVWSSGVTLLQLSTGRPLLTTYLGPGATGISNTDPHKATKVKTSQLLDEINQKCPLTDETRPADVSWKCWDCLRGMLIPEVANRKTIGGALAHVWLEVASSNGNSDVLTAQLDECPSNPILMTPQAAAVSENGEALAASESAASTPRLEVPTPPCAQTPVKLGLGTSVPAARIPALPGSLPLGATAAPRAAQVLKLSIAQTPQPVVQTPLPTPKPTPKSTPHATPIRHIGSSDFARCRRSETAPALQADGTSIISSRHPMTEPPSPCTTSRATPTPVLRTPVSRHVTRARTAFGDMRSPDVNSVRTLENLDENFVNPLRSNENFIPMVLHECDKRLASVVWQLENAVVRDRDSTSRASSIKGNAVKDVPDMRTMTDLVRSCGQTMRRASTASAATTCDEAIRGRTFELRKPHEVARSVTLKPRCRRRAESPLRATMPLTIGSLPSVGLLSSTPAITAGSLPSVGLLSSTPACTTTAGSITSMGLLSSTPACSVTAPSAACSVSVPATAMSVSAPSASNAATGFSLKTDALSRTMPPEFAQKTGTPMSPPLRDEDNSEREAFVCTRPLSVAINMNSKLGQRSTPQASPVCFTSQRSTTTTNSPMTTTTTASTTMERLSPRPYTSSRSPLVPLRASPPPTPSPDTYRDVMLAARSATILTSVPISIAS
mmetsp:Transcript_12613/g.20861  ORF Transcript_12613/g.20861 Transcript_12613/m.20861 type:complete len:1018 (-) Transcript_12613:114-3167(-)